MLAMRNSLTHTVTQRLRINCLLGQPERVWLRMLISARLNNPNRARPSVFARPTADRFLSSVVEIGGQPLFGIGDGLLLPLGVVFNLVFGDFADGEVF